MSGRAIRPASYERLGFATRAHLHLTVVRRGRY
jgi:hypothetical protein